MHMHIQSIILIFSFLVILGSSAQSLPDFCILPCNNLTNVGCKPPGWSKTCPTSRSIVVMTSKYQQLVLDEHNKLRNLTAGGNQKNFSSASQMWTLKWNSTLAYLAELNVKKCEMRHDSCFKTDKFQYPGQNLYSIQQSDRYSDPSGMIAESIRSWYSEYKFTNASSLLSLKGIKSSSGTYGHFTQVVKDNAQFVGCAISRYFGNKIYNSLFACNYSYGNMLNEAVYVVGPAGSKCQKKNTPKYPNLCA